MRSCQFVHRLQHDHDPVVLHDGHCQHRFRPISGSNIDGPIESMILISIHDIDRHRLPRNRITTVVCRRHKSVLSISERNPDVHHFAFVCAIALATNLRPSLDRHRVADPHGASITFQAVAHHIHQPRQCCRILCKLGDFLKPGNQFLHAVAPIHVSIKFLCANVETHLPCFRSNTGRLEECADANSLGCHDVRQKLKLSFRQQTFRR
mmetsp:Transcript_33379/g.72938  ORF Transcript_33379/g.72938 Transcript_33379/m.72938 type:complete len:208 (-) Transcript_33379:604-1227(-)